MKIRKIILLCLLIISLGAVAIAQGSDTPNDWDVIGEGIEFQQYHLSDPVPVNIFVTKMDRNNPNVTIESSIAQGRLSGGIESVSKMAERYDQAINFWGPPTIPVSQTWGSRNNVIVAINGFYYGGFEEPPGVPWSGQIHSGWYGKRFTDDESSSGFVWKMDRSAFIGGCIYHPDPVNLTKNKQYVYDVDSSMYISIDGVNVSRVENELILYTSQFDRDTGTDGDGVEILIEMFKPTYTSVFANMPYGIVRGNYNDKGSTPIPFDHIVLSGHGQKALELSDYLHDGDVVGIAQKVVDCPKETIKNNWDGSYSGVGGHWRFLRGGDIFPYDGDPQAIVHDPRTAIAYNDDYIFFIVADGRDPGVSEGMTVAEMANFVKYTLGATDAIMQDGGGSSTMVINGTLVNQPFNPEWCKFAFLPIALKGENPINQGAKMLPNFSPSIQSEPIPYIIPTTDDGEELTRIEADYPHVVCERPVANGMMMVLVESKEQSDTYSPGNLVATTSESNLYLGPGTNYGILAPISSGSIGEITAHTKALDGVLAKNSYWWQVEFGEEIGWVQEESLIVRLKSAPAVWREDANRIR